MPTSLSTWAEFYQQGGGLMHIIAAIGAVGFAVAIERLWLLVRLDVDAPRLLSAVGSRLVAGDTEGALRACADRPSAVARIVRAGVMASIDASRTRAAVREEQLAVGLRVTRRLPMLSALANLAIMVGLLGTVFGMIGGFTCGAVPLSAEQRAAALAMSIKMAVHTTGFGLLVAVPLLAIGLALWDLAEKIQGDAAHCSAWLVDLVACVRAAREIECAPYR